MTVVTLQPYIRDRQLKARKCGGQWYVTLEVLREFFEYENTKVQATADSAEDLI